MSFLLRSLTSLPKRQLTLPKKQLMVYQQLRGAKMRAQHLEVGPKRRLAYRQVPGQKKPTIVMVPGLHSYLHMQGMTARALLRYFLGGFRLWADKLLVFLVFLSFMFNLCQNSEVKPNHFKKQSSSSSFLNFVYSEKATKFCEMSTLLLSTVHTDKSKVEISQNFVAFSEYMNFTNLPNT